MVKIGAMDFDDRILNALEDGQLIVFAGAGVSMGQPSELPDFRLLADKIAYGTGQSRKDSDKFDGFLGRLHSSGINVHAKAKVIISDDKSRPTQLHYDLLRLFQAADRVKLVTTNYDLHFEAAAKEQFGDVPEIYRAPALPLGRSFSGIVHIHGALPREQSFVLTDSDFGRAYLTEGWARRFLVDVFQNYTVLFVGYSHDDIVMNYLARALPTGGVAGRFALHHTDGNWSSLGIRPILFGKGTDSDEYKELNEGVRGLADLTGRHASTWKTRLAVIGSGSPPNNAEAIGEIDRAMRETHLTRFLLSEIRHPDWLKWLNDNNYLNKIFESETLGEREILIANWFVNNYVLEHPQEVFEVIVSHKMKLNSFLWRGIAWEIGESSKKPISNCILRRWVTILLAHPKENFDRNALIKVANRCGGEHLFDLVRKVFMTMSDYCLNFGQRSTGCDFDGDETHNLNAEIKLEADYWSLNEVWTTSLQPYLAEIAQPLLLDAVLRLEDIHSVLAAWGMVSDNHDYLSFSRLSIEPYGSDRHLVDFDVLIDVARESFEWIAAKLPEWFDFWRERLAGSQAPLVRRLAIHGITVQAHRSAEESLKWLLDRFGLHSVPESEEIRRALAKFYPAANESSRRAVVEQILGHTPRSFDDRSSEDSTARYHFDWLCRLRRMKPDCELVRLELARIQSRYPSYRCSESSGPCSRIDKEDLVGVESPWTIDRLLKIRPSEQLDELLRIDMNRFYGSSRENLLGSIRDASKQDIRWAFSLVRVLAERELWICDIWGYVLRGLQESTMTVNEWKSLLKVLSNARIQSKFPKEIADLLLSMVKECDTASVLELLEESNEIAFALWSGLEDLSFNEKNDSWYSFAINQPAGVIVQFLLRCQSVVLINKSGPLRIMEERYRDWFTLILQDNTSSGGMGRAILAENLCFLYSINKDWAMQFLIPLFSELDRHKFAQAWEGFLMERRVSRELVEILLPAFSGALKRLDIFRESVRFNFIEFYTDLAVSCVSNPRGNWLPDLFGYISEDDRLAFAWRIGFHLRRMSQDAKQQLWKDWLGCYWRDRVDGVYGLPVEKEIQQMLEWLPHLGDAFPVAVDMVIKFKPIRIGGSRFLGELRNSELLTRFANKSAELLIYLSQCNVKAQYLDEINARLPYTEDRLRMRVKEAILRLV